MKRLLCMLVLLGCGPGTKSATKASSVKQQRLRYVPPLPALVPCHAREDLPRLLAERWALPSDVKLVSAACVAGRFPLVSWITVASIEGPGDAAVERTSLWDVQSSTEVIRRDIALELEEAEPCVVGELTVADFDPDGVDEILRVCDRAGQRRLSVERVVARELVQTVDVAFGSGAEDAPCRMSQRVTEPVAGAKRELVIEGIWEGAEEAADDSCPDEARYVP